MGLDLQKKLVTLPLIHALGQADAARRRQMVRILRRGGRRADDRKAVLEFTGEFGGLDYARNKMTDCARSAQSILATFPESPARKAMISLAEYITTRKR